MDRGNFSTLLKGRRSCLRWYAGAEISAGSHGDKDGFNTIPLIPDETVKDAKILLHLSDYKSKEPQCVHYSYIWTMFSCPPRDRSQLVQLLAIVVYFKNLTTPWRTVLFLPLLCKPTGALGRKQDSTGLAGALHTKLSTSSSCFSKPCALPSGYSARIPRKNVQQTCPDTSKHVQAVIWQSISFLFKISVPFGLLWFWIQQWTKAKKRSFHRRGAWKGKGGRIYILKSLPSPVKFSSTLMIFNLNIQFGQI